ncbi:MAG: hypothetical protein QM817_08635 [Archangium sp.]
MKRSMALLGAWLSLAGCFHFDDKLAACRNDAGAWICGDGGIRSDAGATAGLICQSDGGWCWEHPRPAGGRFGAVWAAGPDDLYVGTQFGLVLRRRAGVWSATALGDGYEVTDLCGHSGGVYAGTKVDPTATVDRLFSITGGAATAIGGSAGEVNGIDCGASALWAAHSGGVWTMPWDSTLTPAFGVSSTEQCVGVAEFMPGQVRALCDSIATPSAIVYRESGAPTATFTPDASQSMNYRAADIWHGGDGTLWLGVSGNASGEVWTLAGNDWQLATQSVMPFESLYDGAPWRDGWIAVGGGYGVVIEQQSGVVRRRVVTSAGLSYHSGVSGLPTGEAWIVGEPGCLLERQTDAGWALSPLCGVSFLDFSIGAETLAVSANGLYQRQETGWTKLKDVPGAAGVWANPDGGRAILTDDSLEYRGVTLSFTVSQAFHLVVLDGSRVVVVTEDGQLMDTSLLGAGGNGPSFNFMTPRPRVVVDRTTRTFWAHDSTQVRSSNVAGQWDDAFFDAGSDGGVIEDLSAGFGQVWVAARGSVFIREGSSWRELPRPGRSFGRVVALDGDRVFAYESGSPVAEIINRDGTSVEIEAPPLDPQFQVAVMNGDLWVLGSEGLLRHSIPPPP